MKTFFAVYAGLFVALAISSATPSLAGDYPARPITLVVPYTAGGTTDVNARLVARKVSTLIGESVIVENRAGGGAQIAAASVKRAAADGYTLLVADLHTHAINAALHAELPYDPIKDFVPITLMWNYPSVVVVPQNSPIKSMADLVEAARANPGRLTFASQGVGTTGHLLPEKMMFENKIKMIHVPYKGAAEATNDLIAGRVDFLFAGVSGSILELARSGRIRMLAVTDSVRAELLPDIPTMEEAGFPGYSYRIWYGLVAPAGTPKPIIDRLHDVFVEALHDPEVTRLLVAGGSKVATSTPEEFANLIETDTKRMSVLVEQSGIPRE
jgi:tripartite-type tricarboxylate transporter receptor subunit TctC